MKLARDTWLTFQYEAGLLVRNPVAILIALLQPVTYLALFTPFLKSVLGVSSYGAAYRIYVPSLFAALGIFSGLFAGFALLAAMRQGVITRFRVTPLSRVSLLLGREMMYILLIGFQAVVLTVIALAFGLRVQPADLLLALLLLAMMVLVSVSVSYILAFLMPNEQSLATLVNAISVPLSLLAGVLIPLTVAPLWIRDIARWNPFAWGTNAMRAVFHGQLGTSVVWEASAVLAAVAVVALVWSSRLFSREVA
jgi:ABC-2 type transport system permease protein